MSDRLRAVKGMNDILPDDCWRWRLVEHHAADILNGYGFREIRIPIVEYTRVFTAALGAATDVVEKEMYSFADRNDDSLSLRPEGTAGCVRAVLQNGLLSGAVQRLWYQGPMFRYERPQRGRTRQFHQIGGEVFGAEGPDVDAELIFLLARLWRSLGLTGLTLQLNTLGTPESRAGYRDTLVDYFSAHKDQLDADSVRRLDSNPLRILDSKNPEMKSLIGGAPRLLDDLDDESRDHFEELRQRLDVVGLEYQVTSRLVRGLDYYTRTVFEWVTDELGAQGTICGGGRYDGLVELQGGKPTPAVGFSLGIERVVELMQVQGQGHGEWLPHVYLVIAGDNAQAEAARLSESLRDACPGLRLVCNLGGGSFKAQFKRADRSGAQYAVVLADEELASGRVQLKNLRDASAEQRSLSAELLAQVLNEWLVAGPPHPYNRPVFSR